MEYGGVCMFSGKGVPRERGFPGKGVFLKNNKRTSKEVVHGKKGWRGGGVHGKRV